MSFIDKEYLDNWIKLFLQNYERLLQIRYFKSSQKISVQAQSQIDWERYEFETLANTFAHYAINEIKSKTYEDGVVENEIGLVVMKQEEFLDVIKNAIRYIPIEIIYQIKRDDKRPEVLHPGD